jgi:uncharacterized protein (TIGR02147 family)
MVNKLPDIFNYLNFRKYLEDYKNVRTSLDSRFTHFYICYRLGMKNSRSYFNNIIRGRKNIRADTVRKIIDLLELPSEQADYFRVLVNYDQARQSDEKKFYFDQIVRLNMIPSKIVDENTYGCFTEWYHPVVRELSETFDFKDDHRKLVQKSNPPVTSIRSERLVTLLKKLYLIEKKENISLKSNDKAVATAENVKNAPAKPDRPLSYKRARGKIVNTMDEHKTLAMTIAVSRFGCEQILSHMSQLRSVIRSLELKDERPDKKVYEIILRIHAKSK